MLHYVYIHPSVLLARVKSKYGVTVYMNVYKIAESTELKDYINRNLFDPWRGTPFEGYRYLDNKQKGTYGESLVEQFFKKHARNVMPPLGSNAGHDRIVDGYLTEIKFSLAHTDHKKMCVKPNTFTMNHVSLGKDWQRLVFVGINPEPHPSHIKYMTKDDFTNLLKNDPKTFFEYFSRQQGGKNSTNDDYISSEGKLRKLLQSEYMRDISEWLNEPL